MSLYWPCLRCRPHIARFARIGTSKRESRPHKRSKHIRLKVHKMLVGGGGWKQTKFLRSLSFLNTWGKYSSAQLFGLSLFFGIVLFGNSQRQKEPEVNVKCRQLTYGKHSRLWCRIRVEKMKIFVLVTGETPATIFSNYVTFDTGSRKYQIANILWGHQGHNFFPIFQYTLGSTLLFFDFSI